ncbi:citrate synthase/methylcitrate synthase [Paenibacillus aestuarii]|uniref:Citrate synthase n=1 Tax=Paenibacillus aestuarii TaxID=516965 RepID=A0ABW0KAD9_9BACL|nr:citrate synthase/methylcitrate synthase [Paenibacillus aestuarii]
MASVTGLEGIVAAETELSMVDGEKGLLIYRGYEAKRLALELSYEEAAYLLWYGQLPTEEQLVDFCVKWSGLRALPAEVKAVIDLLPQEFEMMSVLRTAISAAEETNRGTWSPSLEGALRYTALVPSIIAYRYRRSAGLEPVEPNPQLGHVANYLFMLTGEVPLPAHVKALTAYFILAMEHGMNASTFAGRVVLSTQSDMASALCAAIGAMKGPLHGGAPSEVVHMLDAIATKERAEGWLRQRLDEGQRLMGFGHRVYKTFDPRAEALREMIIRLSADDAWFELAVYVESLATRLLDEYKPGRKLYTNVEFYAAAVLRAVNMPSALFTPTFTVSRMVGWTAHLLEQAGCNRIFRPQSIYIGAMPETAEV